MEDKKGLIKFLLIFVLMIIWTSLILFLFKDINTLSILLLFCGGFFIGYNNERVYHIFMNLIKK